MILDHFLFVNIYKLGYSKIWPVGIRHINDSEIEKLIPKLNTSTSIAGLAYSGTRITEDQYALVVGLRWPLLRDRTDRPGLSFWHGILCRPSIENEQISDHLSVLLLGIVRRYAVLIDDVGGIVQSVAKGPMDENWAMDLCQSAVSHLPPLEKLTTRVVSDAQPKWANVHKSKNIRISFPFHELLAVPCLVDFLTSNKIGTRVGGGELLMAVEQQYAAISRSEETAGFQTIDLSADLLAPTFLDQPPLIPDTKDKSDTNDTIIFGLWNNHASTLTANGLLLCCFIVLILLWLLSFKIEFSTLWIDFFSMLGENGIALFIMLPYFYILYNIILKIFNSQKRG